MERNGLARETNFEAMLRSLPPQAAFKSTGSDYIASNYLLYLSSFESVEIYIILTIHTLQKEQHFLVILGNSLNRGIFMDD